ncbi:MAG: iron-sulfur cluster insertion protein ErpA [Pseudomonadota bacterium]
MSAELPVTVSDAAAKRIATILAREDNNDALRVSVEGGGCSGFSYKYDLTDTAIEGDLLIEKSGARVLIDPISVPYLEGSVIDFVDDLMGQSFQITNPNATASCGCGTSFSI